MMMSRLSLVVEGRVILQHLVAAGAVLVGTWPALIVASTPAQAGIKGNCEIRETNKIRCIRGKDTDGVLVDITPLAQTVSFHIQVWHSWCGISGRRGPGLDVTVTRNVTGGNPTYRFNQGLTSVYPSGFKSNCTEFFIENCKDASGQPGNCSLLLDVDGMRAPYVR